MPAMSIALANKNRINYNHVQYLEIKKMITEIRKKKIWHFRKRTKLKVSFDE